MDLACPFVYANGRSCPGQVIRIEVYKADIDWALTPDGRWTVSWHPRSHYHLFCSEKSNHAGAKKQDDDRMKFYYDQLPTAIHSLLESTRPCGHDDIDAGA